MSQILKSEIVRKESIIISSILFNEESREIAINKEIPEDLIKNKHLKEILQTFNAYASVGREPTQKLIIERMAPNDAKKRTQLEQAFQRLKEKFPPEEPDILKIHIKALRQHYLLKKYEKFLEEALSKVKDGEIDPFSDDFVQIKKFIEEGLYELQDEDITDEVKSMDLIEGFQYTMQKMKEALSSDEKSETVTSGYKEIDRVLSGGFTKGTFAIIAARPGMGKTVMMLNMAIEAAKQGAKVLFISIEMSLLQCFQRILCKIADVSTKKLQQPKQMRTEDWKALEKAGKEIVELYDNRFWIDEVTSLTVPQLERRVQQYKKKHDIDLVFVDYAQIMLTKTGNEPEKQEDFAQISSALRRTAKSQNVAVVVGSQLNRKVEERNDKRPIMADIRNSGAFEQDAAQILALYRDEVYNKEKSEKPRIIEVIFLKNRFGEAAKTLDFNYDLDKQAILSHVPRDEEAS